MSNFLHNTEEVAGQLTVQLCIPDQAQWEICYRFHKSLKADAVAPTCEVQRRKKGNTRARGDQSKETFDVINRYDFGWLEMHSAEYGADPVRVSGCIPAASLVSPQLTTLHQPMAEKGRQAIFVLVKRKGAAAA